jgi:hypothetical protein
MSDTTQPGASGDTPQAFVQSDAVKAAAQLPEALEKAKEFVEQGTTGDDFLEKSLNMTMDQLTDEDKQKLSKVLFPETHTDTITVLGRERTLRPTSLKTSRQVYALTKSVQEKIQQSQDADVEPALVSMDEFEKDYEEVILKTLTDVAKCLCSFYGKDWDDIKVAAVDEDLSLSELQAIAYTQQELNTSNDFFLQPLRAFVRVLQAREVSMLLMEKYVTTTISFP